MSTLALVMVIAGLVGANYGANLAVIPAMTKDFFGLKHFGLNYGFGVPGLGHRRPHRLADRRVPDRRPER